MKCIFIDVDRCTGCFACTVACMDQHDQDRSYRRVIQVEKNEADTVKIAYLALACMHCQDAPCVMACPTGSISKKEDRIEVREELCIGCHSCAMACPFGVPRFGKNGKMEKCNLCAARLFNGLEPACIRVCPAKALKFGDADETLNQIQDKKAIKLSSFL